MKQKIKKKIQIVIWAGQKQGNALKFIYEVEEEIGKV